MLVSAGTASVIGTAAAGSPGHTSINNNTQHGILVDGTGYVTINQSLTTNVATAMGQAYVDLDDNNVAGLWIAQAGATSSQTNAVSFVEASGIKTGNGIHVNGGSFLTLRGSFLVGNHDSGVFVGAGTGATADTISGIDLGDTTTDGQNTLQGPIGSLNNPVAGVCLGIPAPTGTTAGQTLLAVGNTWGVVNVGTVSCEKTGAGGKLSHAATCGNGVDLGGVGTTTTGTNTADISICTYQ